MTRWHRDIIDDRNDEEAARTRAKLRKQATWGLPLEKKKTQIIRATATRRKKVPITLPKVNF